MKGLIFRMCVPTNASVIVNSEVEAEAAHATMEREQPLF